ncbi:MAG: nitroreductase family protein [Caldiserica bacterium]|nr:nitroreductase family protein [Caldisericota bacterium]
MFIKARRDIQIPHTCRGVVTRHADKATEAARKEFMRLPDDRKPVNTRNHKAKKRLLANALPPPILLLYRTSRGTGGRDTIKEALVDTIRNRRSIRKYTAQPVPQELVTRLLEAEGIGLGGVWLGVYPHDERVKGLAELLGLPSSVVPLSIVALGYPAEKKPPTERFDPSQVHTNRW